MHNFIISNLATGEVFWELAYDPSKEVPFVTTFGTSHVWNWDFVIGALVKDGEVLLGYSIVIK